MIVFKEDEFPRASIGSIGLVDEGLSDLKESLLIELLILDISSVLMDMVLDLKVLIPLPEEEAEMLGDILLELRLAQFPSLVLGLNHLIHEPFLETIEPWLPLDHEGEEESPLRVPSDVVHPNARDLRGKDLPEVWLVEPARFGNDVPDEVDWAQAEKDNREGDEDEEG
jgi:hypothetical protein